MASGLENEFTRLIEEAMDDIDQKMEKAFKNTMKRMEQELKEVMRDATVSNFYGGYFPIVYQRTGQLNKAIDLQTQDTSYGDQFSFNVIPIYDETKMNHSEYNIIATYRHKKNKKFTGKVSTYKCHVKLKEQPDEEKILEMTLGAGYHPRVGTAGTIAPIWDDDNDGYLFEQLADYIENNASEIFNEEYDKL